MRPSPAVSTTNRFAILVGGGPAPGINGVIAAAAQHALRSGHEVLGVREGFARLIQGDRACAPPLGDEEVERIAQRGGSYLGISRANPTKDPAKLEAAVSTLVGLGVDKLITIGGDDTAFSAYKVAQHSAGRLRVAHVPKTIDNDLDLPEGVSTFGFQTARHVGAQIVGNLMTDAQTTTRWFFVVAMGRKAGHLALGMGKAAGATLTLIGEEYAGAPLKAATVVDALAGAVIKRAALGLPYGVAVLAEGLVELLDESEIASMGNVERDAHGHIRIAEIPFGDIVKAQVQKRLAEVGAPPTTVIAKNVGYELRCVDPTPFDAEYTRDLGYAAARFLLEGGSGAMVTVQGGKLTPKAFDDILDPKTGRMRVRLVDANSDNLRVARAYMTRLLKADLDDAQMLRKLASVTKLSPEAFKDAFAHVAA